MRAWILLLAILFVPLAAAQDYDIERDDPEGDVHRTTAQDEDSPYGLEQVSGHEDIDIVASSSSRSGSTLTLTLKVLGTIRTEYNPGGQQEFYSYGFSLDVRDSSDPDYVISFAAGMAHLTDTNSQGSPTPLEFDLDGDTVQIFVPMDLLGDTEHYMYHTTTSEMRSDSSGSSFEQYLDIDTDVPGQAVQSGSTQTTPPGNDGPATDDTDESDDTPGLGVLACLAAVAVALVRRRTA